ncbi:hypothetical protein CFC21_089948 [Triticum aestivum]|uniref:F-box domain-containing protein n=2 Tax=Triticum aestivum TaxID=4565 RepID=A0A9R1INL2_WHEAT|nr:hypothetical protein CFC21_089948 [Triticum aestivum]
MHTRAAASGEDLFRVLPDELLRHVISFLPSDDALQTCVLDTRWRNLWRSTTSLDLNFVYGCSRILSCERFKTMVKLIILLRGNSLLVKGGINACENKIQSACAPARLSWASIYLGTGASCSRN